MCITAARFERETNMDMNPESELAFVEDEDLELVCGGQDMVVAQMWAGNWALTVSATANSYDSALFWHK
jgi:hypothetical protein